MPLDTTASKTQAHWRLAFLVGYTLLVTYGMLVGLGREDLDEYRYNLIPFTSIYHDLITSGINPFWLMRFTGNIVLFIPFGILLPKIWPLRYWQVLAIHTLGICALETLQLITQRGMLDIDDLILNTLGMTIGYAIHQNFQRNLPITTPQS